MDHEQWLISTQNLSKASNLHTQLGNPDATSVFASPIYPVAHTWLLKLLALYVYMWHGLSMHWMAFSLCHLACGNVTSMPTHPSCNESPQSLSMGSHGG